jgi:hypothetical protein
MVEVSALKLRLLQRLRDEQPRTINYFNSKQARPVLEMVAAGWARVRRDHIVVLTAAGHNVLKAKGITRGEPDE